MPYDVGEAETGPGSTIDAVRAVSLGLYADLGCASRRCDAGRRLGQCARVLLPRPLSSSWGEGISWFVDSWPRRFVSSSIRGLVSSSLVSSRRLVLAPLMRLALVDRRSARQEKESDYRSVALSRGSEARRGGGGGERGVRFRSFVLPVRPARETSVYYKRKTMSRELSSLPPLLGRSMACRCRRRRRRRRTRRGGSDCMLRRREPLRAWGVCARAPRPRRGGAAWLRQLVTMSPVSFAPTKPSAPASDWSRVIGRAAPASGAAAAIGR
jgi:hypothetical protein